MGSFQVLHTRADPLSPKEERVIQSWWSKSSNDYSPLAGLLLKSDLWPYVGLIIAPPAIPYLSVLSTPEKMSINSVLRAAVGIHQFCPPSYCGNPLYIQHTFSSTMSNAFMIFIWPNLQR